MTSPAASVIDLEHYRELRRLAFGALSRSRESLLQQEKATLPGSPAESPDVSEALESLRHELRHAELRLIDLAATIDELYAQLEEMSQR